MFCVILIIAPSGLKPWQKHQTLKMNPDAFLKICNTFFNHAASTGCIIDIDNCLLHYMCSGKKKPQNMSPQTFYTCFQKALHAFKLLDCCYERDLDDNKAKILFFSKERIQDYAYYGNCDFNFETLENLKKFSNAIMMLILPKRPINNMIDISMKSKPLVTIVSLSLLVMMTIQCLHPPSCWQILLTTLLAINLALDSNGISACYECTINAVFVKPPVQSNGLIAECTILPLVPRQPKNWQVTQNCKNSKTSCICLIVHSLFRLAAMLRLSHPF